MHEKITGDSDIAAATHECEFPSEKTVELRVKYRIETGVEYVGIAKYHLEKKYWILRPYKNGTVLYKGLRIKPKKSPKLIGRYLNEIILEYDNYRVFIIVKQDGVSAERSDFNKWPLSVKVNPEEYVEIYSP